LTIDEQAKALQQRAERLANQATELVKLMNEFRADVEPLENETAELADACDGLLNGEDVDRLVNEGLKEKENELETAAEVGRDLIDCVREIATIAHPHDRSRVEYLLAKIEPLIGEDAEYPGQSVGMLLATLRLASPTPLAANDAPLFTRRRIRRIK
jgi:hypothetical protein